METTYKAFIFPKVFLNFKNSKNLFIIYQDKFRDMDKSTLI